MTTEDADRLAVGVIGLGGMGQTHANNVLDAGHTVVAGVDVVETLRESFAADYDANVYPDHTELFASEELDAVVVATPNVHHEAPAVAAFEHDVAALIEKPLAADLAAAERIAAAADASDAVGMVGLQQRFAPAAELVRNYREDGFFGDVVHLETNYVRRRGIPTIGSWFTDAELSGGGAVLDIGVHAIDFALALADFPEPVEVTGVTRQIYAEKAEYADVRGWSDKWTGQGDAFDVEDSATALVRCADDLTLSIDIAWALDQPPTRDVLMVGTGGGARMSLGGEEVTLFGASTEGPDHYVDTQLTGANSVNKHAAEMAHFLEGVAAGEPPERGQIEQALTVQRVMDGIYRSSDTGAAVRLD